MSTFLFQSFLIIKKDPWWCEMSNNLRSSTTHGLLVCPTESQLPLQTLRDDCPGFSIYMFCLWLYKWIGKGKDERLFLKKMASFRGFFLKLVSLTKWKSSFGSLQSFANLMRDWMLWEGKVLIVFMDKVLFLSASWLNLMVNEASLWSWRTKKSTF